MEPNETDEQLRRLAQVRAIAQEQIFSTVRTTGVLAKEVWIILLAILAATVFVTQWMGKIETNVEGNTKHIRTLWMDRYHVEP